jgi:cardiolipin synthase C
MCVLAVCLGAGVAGGCSILPPVGNRTASTATIATGDTKLGQAIAPLIDAHPGKSGIYALPDALDAFAARALLA